MTAGGSSGTGGSGTVAPDAVVSADSHVVEPHYLWRDRVPRAYAERAPRLVHEEATDRVLCEGHDVAPVGLLAGCFRSDEDVRVEGRWDEDVPPCGYDPAARLKEIDADGVDVEVLFPTIGMHLYPVRDPGLRWALFRAYNDWLAEFCAAAPARLKGVAMINHEDVTESVSEIERSAGLGLSAVMVPMWAGEDCAYHDPAFDAVWAAATAAGMPVAIHTSTSRDPERAWNKGSASTNWVLKNFQIQQTMLEAIFYGLFDRFPGLQVVSAENDAGWAGNVIERADFWWRRNRRVYAGGGSVVCAETPSHYFGRNVTLTFMRDRTALLASEVIGPSALMWGSDFPHHVSTWPASMQTLDDQLAGVDPAVRRAVTRDNVCRVFGW